MPPPLTPAERQFLSDAVQYLERPHFLMKVADTIGKPAEWVVQHIPEGVARYANDALMAVMNMAVNTVPTTENAEATTRDLESTGWWSQNLHAWATAVTGAAGGLFGWAGLGIELPITTGIMFRSIASIAADFGEDLNDPAVRLECLTVFSHGGPSPDNEAMESSYLTARLALAKLVRDAAEFIVRNSGKALADEVARGTAPVVVRLMTQVAAQFNVVVSEKFLAQSIPVLGLASGAAINTAFTTHFNTVARYHFGIRKLQRRYGAERVDAAYLEALRQWKPESRPALGRPSVTP